MQLDETFGRQSNGRPLTLMCKCSWLLEEQSTSTVENALHSLDIMKQKGLRRCDQLQGVPQEDISTQLGPHIALLEVLSIWGQLANICRNCFFRMYFP
eukprot:scaffold46161_cov17-Tisochrysis_lutea.AAC.1